MSSRLDLVRMGMTRAGLGFQPRMDGSGLMFAATTTIRTQKTGDAQQQRAAPELKTP